MTYSSYQKDSRTLGFSVIGKKVIMKKLAVQKHGSANYSLPITHYQTYLTLGETGLYISSEHLAYIPVKAAPGAYFAPYN